MFQVMNEPFIFNSQILKTQWNPFKSSTHIQSNFIHPIMNQDQLQSKIAQLDRNVITSFIKSIQSCMVKFKSQNKRLDIVFGVIS